MISLYLHIFGLLAVLASAQDQNPSQTEVTQFYTDPPKPQPIDLNYVGPKDPNQQVPNIVQPINNPYEQLGPGDPGNGEPKQVQPIQIAYTASIVPTYVTDVPPGVQPTPVGEVTGGHTACVHNNFGGDCVFYSEPPNTGCHNYPVERYDVWTTIRPNPGQWCMFYEYVDCYGGAVTLQFPGSENLRGKRFDNRVKSWNCFKLDGPRGPGS